MAVKLTKRQTEHHRQSIQVAALLTRLRKNGMGTLTTPKGNALELTSGQIKSIQILIDKAMPNLSAIEQTHIEEPVSRQSMAEELKQVMDSLTIEERNQLVGRKDIDTTAEEVINQPGVTIQ